MVVSPESSDSGHGLWESCKQRMQSSGRESEKLYRALCSETVAFIITIIIWDSCFQHHHRPHLFFSGDFFNPPHEWIIQNSRCISPRLGERLWKTETNKKDQCARQCLFEYGGSWALSFFKIRSRVPQFWVERHARLFDPSKESWDWAKLRAEAKSQQPLLFLQASKEITSQLEKGSVEFRGRVV